MARWSSLREALVLSLKNWRLWLVQFAGNAIIFALFYGLALVRPRVRDEIARPI